MPTIKSIVVKNMRIITLIMVVIILFLSTFIQILSMRQTARQNATQIFSQVEQIIDENSSELEQVQKEYEAMCLDDARTIAYILEYNPEARSSQEELKKIAKNAEVDEIHIFDKSGVIVAGTHPEYFGYSFDSGGQISFFKPLLTDKSLELVQEITPNTAEGKLVQYSALWSEDGKFILQIGMYPSSVLRATKKNELSYIFSLLRTGVGYSLYAINPDTAKVVGATSVSDVNKDVTEIGLRMEELEPGNIFHAKVNQVSCHCFIQEIGGNFIVWTYPLSEFVKSILINEFLLLIGLLVISQILVNVVTSTMNRTVIYPIKKTNECLRSIQDGNLNTKADTKDSREFSELSAHINSMVDSLLQSSEKLEMSEKIRSQKEELERQHEELEIAVEQAQAANKAKSEFLFNMSHDIRTPMNAILGFTNLALESSDPQIQKEYLKNIDISSKQLMDLLNNILELSRIENHKIVIDEDLVNVNDTYFKLYTVFENELKKKHLNYKVSLDIKHPYMYMDTTHFAQIFLNIINNAIKYTPDGGSIKVSFKEIAGHTPDTCIVESIIEDSGIGMSKDFLDHAYESFARERTSTVSGLQGSGLGLAIVKNLVDLMRGTIDIESLQGKGTKVTIWLPHRFGEAPLEKPEEETESFARVLFEGRRILLAEDIDINAMIATKLLTAKGFMVERAKDGVECVDMLLKAEAGYYDLILMDIQMPIMDGYRAAQSIRAFKDKKKASVPILALTANTFKEDCDKAVEAGMNGHIAKPLEASKMFLAISEVLQ